MAETTNASSFAADFESAFRAATSQEAEAFPPLPQGALKQLAGHAWAVRDLNQRLNLTRIVDPAEMARKHTLDSLFGARFIAALDPAPRRIIDVGTGAGWPGLSLATVLPSQNTLLIDSTRKKVDAVREIAASIDLIAPRVECRWTRLEQLTPEDLDGALLVARAVGPVVRLLRWLPRGTARAGASLLLWKGPALEEELTDAATEIDRRGFRVSERVPYQIPEDPVARALVHLIPTVARTPEPPTSSPGSKKTSKKRGRRRRPKRS